MIVNGIAEVQPPTEQNYDRKSEIKAFDDTKAGVKGLVDAGITQVPRMFIRPPDCADSIPIASKTQFNVPIIDLQGMGMGKDPAQHKQIVEKIQEAAENWGFFQVVNHGIPISVIDEMINGVVRFNEQETEVKKQWYTRDNKKPFVFNSNMDLYVARAAKWRDTIYCPMAPKSPNPEELPAVCRDIFMEYSKKVMKLGYSLFELLSEGLGLDPSYLINKGCARDETIVCHYSPECPQPELTFGTSKHSDFGFITVLLQDHVGGLQVLHQDKWVDVLPIPGALVVNIGDFLQVMSNDKLISVEHRVLASYVGPRVSVAFFFGMGLDPSSMLCEPIKELLSEKNPPKYKAFTMREFLDHFRIGGVDGVPGLLHFKLKN